MIVYLSADGPQKQLDADVVERHAWAVVLAEDNVKTRIEKTYTCEKCGCEYPYVIGERESDCPICERPARVRRNLWIWFAALMALFVLAAVRHGVPVVIP